MNRLAVNQNKKQLWLAIIIVISTLLTVVAHSFHADALEAHLESIDCKLCQNNIDLQTPTLDISLIQQSVYLPIQLANINPFRTLTTFFLPPLRAPPISNI